jgi:hypothetical protein
MFTIADLQEAMSHSIGYCGFDVGKYNLHITFGDDRFSNPNVYIPYNEYTSVEIQMVKNGTKIYATPQLIDGFLWGAYFDGVIGKYIPLQTACDIINFLRGDTSTSVKNDILCQHCGKPNDHGSVSCWWCEKRF